MNISKKAKRLFGSQQTEPSDAITTNYDDLAFNALYRHTPIIQFKPDGSIIEASEPFCQAMGPH